MSFSDFTLPKVQHDFGLTFGVMQPLFRSAAPVPLSQVLQLYLNEYSPLGLSMPTEKGRTEVLVSPFLSEVWMRTNHQVGVLSGVEFNVDEALGLNGVCDFLLTRSPQLLYVESPVLCLDEAKRDSIPDTLGQCAAEMVAAQRFNQRNKEATDTIYGCVTTGANWRFLKLQGTTLSIDLDEYQIVQPERILGILLYCVGASGT